MRLFTFLCQNKRKTLLKKKDVCGGKDLRDTQFFFFRIIIYFSSISGTRSRLPPFWTKDVGLGHIFLLDRVADLARII